MREIKFRAKRIDNGEWIEGDLIQLHDGRKFIINNQFGACIDTEGKFINTEAPFVNQVDPATVGQFSGLLDKNGVEIWENDEVLATLKYFNIKNQRCKIIFHDGSFGVQHGFSPDYFKTISAWDEIEVIGTNHDAQGDEER